MGRVESKEIRVITVIVNIPEPIQVHVHAQDARITDLLRVQSEHGAKLETLLAVGESLMGKIDEQNALLDQINNYTNQLAEQQQAESEKLTEIGNDLDELVSQVSDTSVSTRLSELKDQVANAAAAGAARAETLTNLAAKYDQPLPPPVEPEEPPVEPTPEEPTE